MVYKDSNQVSNSILMPIICAPVDGCSVINKMIKFFNPSLIFLATQCSLLCSYRKRILLHMAQPIKTMKQIHMKKMKEDGQQDNASENDDKNSIDKNRNYYDADTEQDN